LTQKELDERSQGFPRFWAESNVPGQRLQIGWALTALEVAAKVGNLEIFDILRAARADESTWVQGVLLDDEQDQVRIQEADPLLGIEPLDVLTYS
jgi:hypothetical protein